MERRLKFSLFFLGVLATLMLTFGSCNNKSDYAPLENDSSAVCAKQDSLAIVSTNPITEVLYTSVDQFLTEQCHMQTDEAIKEAFLSMSPQMIERVGRVVLSKHPDASIDDLVTEYRIHYDVYSRQLDDNEPIPRKVEAYSPLTKPDSTNSK